MRYALEVRPSDWVTSSQLRTRLEAFFDDDEIPYKTLHHLYNYLGVDETEYQKRKAISTEMERMLTVAEQMAVMWIVERGFDRDSGFSRFYLHEYAPSQSALDEKGIHNVQVNFVKVEHHHNTDNTADLDVIDSQTTADLDVIDSQIDES